MQMGHTEGDAFLDLAARRRSTRLFEDRPVPPEVVRRVIQAALYAPTACNRQLWHFVVITDKALKARVAHLGDRNSQLYLYDAPVLVAIFYDTSMEDRNPCHTAPVTTGMAIYAMLLAAEAEGLGAICMGGISNPIGVAEAVGAPSFLRNFGIVCLGYRADDPPAPSRRTVEEVTSWNACDVQEKRFHPDVRPHVWSLRQLADFRDKLLWYKGIGIDGLTLHVNPDARFSPKLAFLTDHLGMTLARYTNPVALDVFAHNGDLVLQLLGGCGDHVRKVYAYDLTQGIADYMVARFRVLLETDKLEYLVNPGTDRIHIPLADNSVDVMSCYERLGHFDDPRPLLREMYRVLRPGGTAVVATSNRYYPHLYWYRRMIRGNYALGRNWDFGPERKFGPEEITRLFRDAGFQVADCIGLQPVEMRLASKLSGICQRWGLAGVANRLQEVQSQLYTRYGWSRKWCQTLIHDLTKNSGRGAA